MYNLIFSSSGINGKKYKGELQVLMNICSSVLFRQKERGYKSLSEKVLENCFTNTRDNHAGYYRLGWVNP